MPAPAEVRLIPLAEIDPEALQRDRTRIDAAALDELRGSIVLHGLRMPVEVLELAQPYDGFRYGLISGYRRLAAVRAIHEFTTDPAFAAIPAFVRDPATFGEAIAAMVEENAVRADLSPWEQGMAAVTARDSGAFPNIEAAVDGLYAAASAAKRSRLRTLAHLAETLRGVLAAPETLSIRQALRLANAVRGGYAPVIEAALATGRRSDDPGLQWQTILPILIEAERSATDSEPDFAASAAPGSTSRPRRLLNPRHGLYIRREITRHGWCLHFTGREATSPLLDTVFDEIERMFGPA